MTKVKANDNIKVHYTGTLNSGEVFDSSEGREPLAFTAGAGQMIKGFDDAVIGMELNESKTVTIPSEEAYGPVQDQLIQEIPKSSLPEGLNPEVGQKLSSRYPDGQEVIVEVVKATEDSITIDANHVLAGKDLTFEIKVVEIN